MKERTLLLDIDYTLFYNEKPRPYLKEFLIRANETYNLGFYTAASSIRIAEVCRVLYHQLGFDIDFINELRLTSLHRDNCPMIEIESGASVKSLIKASQILNVPVETIILLDDNPKYDNPHADQVIQAEGYMGEEDDDYLLRVKI
jgi:TFIIF-interacting CTD phosphatase-like protein